MTISEGKGGELAVEAMSDQTRGPKLPKVNPDGYAASVILSFLATAGFFYINIMPALVTGLVDGLGFSNQQSGQIASANVYGAALGAFIVVFFVKRVPWRRAAVITLTALIAIDLISMVFSSWVFLLVIRFLHGFVGGFLVGVSLSVIARSRFPDRTFGVLLVVQFGFGGLGVMTLPRLVPLYGYEVLFMALLALSCATFAMLPFLPDYPQKKTVPVIPGKGPIQHNGLLILTLCAIFLFQAANMGVAAYIIALGRQFGLETGFISSTLGAAAWIGMVGPVLVIVLGTWLGRFWPVLAAMMLTFFGTLMFHFSDIPVIFIVANCGTAITWAFVMPYLLGMCAALDQTGQTAALAGFFSKMGLASGPMAGAYIVAGGNYDLLINIAVGGLMICAIFALIPAYTLDRRRSVQPRAG
tara:strand:- start:3948 stop:5189 length:1242 start_codon:yes stop_codon:yes gene_type:complete